MVCSPAALVGGPKGWAAETLRDGEVALLADADGLEAIFAAAHTLDLVTVALVRSEQSPTVQAQTVIAFAGSLPLVWVGEQFSSSVQRWATERGPMTLLVEAQGGLRDDQRSRIGRFVALLGRQTE